MNFTGFQRKLDISHPRSYEIDTSYEKGFESVHRPLYRLLDIKGFNRKCTCIVLVLEDVNHLKVVDNYFLILKTHFHVLLLDPITLCPVGSGSLTL